jgi:hypothetical protein
MLLLAVALAFWLPAARTEAQAVRTYVSGLGKDTNPCTAAAPCLTLQAALAQTAPGGQIYSLNSANYGYVTINKAVSILAGRGAAGVLATSSLTGVTINAGAGDVITLQGLDIDGAGSGVSGIEFYSGASLNIQDTAIRGFTNGINFQSGGSSTLLVSRTLISNNSTGINFRSSVTSTAVLNDVQLVNNGTGIAALGASTTAPANVTIRSSVVANNSTVGIAAGAYSAVSVANTTITNNAAGLQAQAASSLVRLSGSSVTGNRVAWLTTNGGQITSLSQNSFGGNTIGDTAPPSSSAPPPPPSSPPPPAYVTKNIVTDFGATCNGSGDDNPAFTAFNTWALNWQKANTGLIELVIPSGSVCMFTSTSLGNQFAKGIKKLLVTGYGATLSDNLGTGNGYFLGAGRASLCDGPYDCTNALLATVPAGSTTITLLNPADASNFSVNSYALMTGLDLQGFGSPPNNHFFEYVYITDISGSTITLRDPLKYSYSSKWPYYQPGSVSSPDLGGPAELRILKPEWDIDHEYRGLTLAQDAATKVEGRSITLRDCFFPPAQTSVSTGANPSVNQSLSIINCNGPKINIEVDKLVTQATWSGGTYNSMQVQSTSVDVITLDGVTFTSFVNGSPKKLVIQNNSNIASLLPGAIGYGVSSEMVISDSVISEIGIGGYVDTNVTAKYTISNGVISSSDRDNGPVAWAVPGANIFFAWSHTTDMPAVQVTDVTQDNGFTRIYTTLPGGWPGPSGAGLVIRTHPAPRVTCSNATGSEDILDICRAPAGAPLFSYTRRTYSGNIGYPPPVRLWGMLTSIKQNVTAPYGGIPNPLILESLEQYGANTVRMSNNSTYYYDPRINLSIAGERMVTPSGLTGLQPGDSGLSVPEPLWFADQVRPYLSASAPGVPPVTIEITTDQGVVNP